MKRPLAGLVLLPLLLACSGTTSSDREAEVDVETDDLTGCASGRAEARDFSPGEKAGIVEMANKATFEQAQYLVEPGPLAAILLARPSGPFESIEQVACIPGVGKASLDGLSGVALLACHNYKHPAARSASARTCAAPIMATPCGNDPFTPTHPVQVACNTPVPAGKFARDIVGTDAFPMLPSKIEFANKQYTATFATGKVRTGRAQQREKSRLPSGAYAYIELYKGASGENALIFELNVGSQGTTLRLDPLIGPVGRDIKAPTFNRTP